MNKRELSRLIKRMATEVKATEIYTMRLQIALDEEDSSMDFPQDIQGIHEHLGNVLDNLAVVERECRIRYQREKRNKENA